ncbi:MAG: 2-oxoglutarate dehydrogenase E1 subunit family protein, partial [Acetobacteraceae bacterium]
MAGVDILAGAFNGANAAFLTDLYARWATDPRSVDPSFAELFTSLDDEARAVQTDALGASWAPRRPRFGGAEADGEAGVAPGGEPPPTALDQAGIRAAQLDSIRALMLIRAYRVRGHLEAKLDPLGLAVPKRHAELDPASYGFSAADFDRPIFIANVLGRDTATLREILEIVRATYCGPIGIEFMHIQDPDQKSWLQRKIEGAPWVGAFDAAAKRT